MGRKSRAKKNLSSKSRKLLKGMVRSSKPSSYTRKDGSIIALNPLKRMLKSKTYKDEMGLAATVKFLKKYEKYLKSIMLKENNNA